MILDDGEHKIKSADVATEIARSYLKQYRRYADPRRGYLEGDTWLITCELDVLDRGCLRTIAIDAFTGMVIGPTLTKEANHD